MLDAVQNVSTRTQSSVLCAIAVEEVNYGNFCCQVHIQFYILRSH